MTHHPPLNWNTSEFDAHLQFTQGASPHTRAAYRRDLQQWAKLAPLLDLPSIKAALQKPPFAKLKAKSLARKISALRSYLLFLLRYRGVPSAELDSLLQFLKSPKLPESIPSPAPFEEIQKLIDSAAATPAHEGPEWIRARNLALLGLLFGSGLRVSELVALESGDIDRAQGFVRVRGKGAKERLVPLAHVCIEWIHTYLELRPPVTEPKIFLNHRNRLLTRQGVWEILRVWCRSAGLPRNYSPHKMRHAFATQLLAGGMGLRELQQLLGHSSLDTTQIYTEVEDRTLQEIIRTHHPRGD